MIFSIIGGDERMVYLSNLLLQAGHTVRMCAFEKHKGHIPCVSVGDAVFGAHCIVLPVPTTKDGKTVFTPLGKSEILLSDMVSAADKKTVFLTAGTKIGAEHEYDYLAREEFSLLNAVPTVEGAISAAVQNTDFTIWNSRCLVIGYGRIGKLLCHRLSSFGCSITTTYRKPEVLSLIDANGINAVHINELEKNISDFDIIFNTIPYVLLGENELKKVKSDAVIIELASPPYGIDFSAAGNFGIKVITASGLPAKTAPKTAAKIIFDTANNILKEHF